MKLSHFSILFLLVLLPFVSCKDDVTDMGTAIQPEGDKIIIKTDTFYVSTENLFVEKMYNRPDSFLIGTFYDSRYGSTHADILTQFDAPFDVDENPNVFRFPEGAVADSAYITLSYQSWFGNKDASMEISAYEMTKSTFEYDKFYPSDIKPEDYVDFANPILGRNVFAASDSATIGIKLSDDFTRDIFEIVKTYESHEDFLDKFKGVYITSNFGHETMIYVREGSMNLYLRYRYDAKVNGNDTTFYNTILMPANSSVTQVNRFQHPDTTEIKNHLSQHPEIHYISSPANMYAQVNIPIRRIVESMQQSVGYNKNLIVNSAKLRVEAVEAKNTGSDLPLPVPANMLLMAKEEVDKFFTENSLPPDTAGIVYSAYSSTDSCYVFDIAKYITYDLKDDDGKINIPDEDAELEMVLVPVRVTLSTNSSSGTTSVSAIKQQVLMNGVTIRSGKDPNRPMKINMLYSGF
ncbi:DUF4270 domain-containing protein [Paludibacter sp. 221]|uniref:DUF4270 domain-containing protein n=1 Tax=Paludibacter sp. 221 TaxID=2302939 RepID=UPI0013D8335B|nr:DUF4270 domain-containing protein [Paludibacter sp. 221]NDV47436.1 DUF4270 domain-containing protein [Paludibacter sp. 221]